MEMKSWFLKCGYSNNVLEKEIKKVKLSKISSTREDNAKGVPLMVTYHPGLKSISQIIKNLQLLYMDQEVKKVYMAKPMASFCSASKLSSYLVRTKLYPLKRKMFI